MSDISEAALSRYLNNGLRTPTVENVVSLARTLNVTTDYLLGRSDVTDTEVDMQQQLQGNEKFTFHGSDTGITVSDFWSWAYSDMFNNTYRGVLAEFLVYLSIGSTPASQIRVDWKPFDLTSPTGRRIEVKSAAYLQSWEQGYFSRILFDIAPKSLWDKKSGYSVEKRRHSDLYVFCVYTAERRKQSILDLEFWDFYVLPTSVLDKELPEQKKISLPSLIKLNPIKTDYDNLGTIIETIAL